MPRGGGSNKQITFVKHYLLLVTPYNLRWEFSLLKLAVHSVSQGLIKGLPKVPPREGIAGETVIKLMHKEIGSCISFSHETKISTTKG